MPDGFSRPRNTTRRAAVNQKTSETGTCRATCSMVVFMWAMVACSSASAPPTSATSADDPEAADSPSARTSEPASEPTCAACSTDECLDAADAVKAANPDLARQLAERGCSIEDCGYVGTAARLRCRSYGIGEDSPQSSSPRDGANSLHCQEMCIGGCRGEMDAGANTKCIDACVAERCR